eukprot:6139826-Prymnesium_polylepis.1
MTLLSPSSSQWYVSLCEFCFRSPSIPCRTRRPRVSCGTKLVWPWPMVAYGLCCAVRRCRALRGSAVPLAR